jgi:hypothetical protein
LTGAPSARPPDLHDGTLLLGTSSAARFRIPSRRPRRPVWTDDDNIVGFGISAPDGESRQAGELALTVYLERKLPASQVLQMWLVPPSLDIPLAETQLPLLVKECGRMEPQMLTSYAQPILGGYSIGTIQSTGSVGCLVFEIQNPDRFLVLGANHVLAGSSRGSIGDPIFQPGPRENDPMTRPVARLLKWNSFDYSGNYTNRMDAALAEPIEASHFVPEVFRVGRPGGVGSPLLHQRVQKSGRTTGHTWSIVRDINFRPKLRYPHPTGSGSLRIGFIDQVLCTVFTAPGDSGAVVFDQDRHAVGLHICGSSQFSVFSPIRPVLDAFQLEIVT